jgi:hypothetical protein
VIIELSNDDSSYTAVDGDPLINYSIEKPTGITDGTSRFTVPFNPNNSKVYGRYVRIHSTAFSTITALRAGVNAKLYTECLKNATCDGGSRKYVCKRHFCDG